ncbi:MAG: hypothetical protein GQ570_06795 [Helicobacteraceae bacterium]|nr:hypothetical protein [Helicobacteraceae bacterium]
MKKLFLVVFLMSAIVNVNYVNSSFTANAGVIKWGVKKLIGGAVKIIFSSAKDSIVEKAKGKLLNYLKTHPEYVDYAENIVRKQIDKHPKYKVRGYKLLGQIASYAR